MNIIDLINAFASTHQWIFLVVSLYVVIVNAIKGVRDAIDTTPETDDNWFERLSTISYKTVGYLAGIRPKTK